MCWKVVFEDIDRDQMIFQQRQALYTQIKHATSRAKYVSIYWPCGSLGSEWNENGELVMIILTTSGNRWSLGIHAINGITTFQSELKG